MRSAIYARLAVTDRDSGMQLRPHLAARLLSDARAGRIDQVVVWKMDIDGVALKSTSEPDSHIGDTGPIDSGRSRGGDTKRPD